LANPFFLNNLAINPNYDFLKTIQSDDDSDFDICSPYDSVNFDCRYSDLSSFVNKSRNTRNIPIMSLNIQSLSAKFSEFKEFICILDKSNTSPDIICLQELWSIHSHSSFNLPGYDPLIYKSRSSGVQGGGGGDFT